MDRNEILDNIRQWRERISDASSKWGNCEICAVTKTHDAETINTVLDGGLDTIGENRVQELLGKIDQLDPRLKIHLIGSLQTNKVKQVTGRISLFQSLDRIALAEELSRRYESAGLEAHALIQVNIAREPQKGGVYIEDLEALLQCCSSLPALQVDGLMGIMPAAENPEDVRIYFRELRQLFERLRERDINHIHMNILSMGMSNDCLVAASEGATMVRLGRALFGARPTTIEQGVV